MRRLTRFTFLLAFLFPTVPPSHLPTCVAGERLTYPATKTVDVVDSLHGERVPDPYRWLENDDDPQVRAWTDQENALTRSVLDRFTQQRAALTAQLEKLCACNVSTPPVIYGDKYFFVKREGLQEQPILYYRDGGVEKPPRVVIDPNQFGADGTVALDWWFPSPDGSLVAYGRSEGGSELSTMRLRDVASGGDTALSIPNMRAATVAWEPGNQAFFYARYPAPGSVPAGDENYYRRVYRHKFGTSVESDVVVFDENRPKQEWPDVELSGDRKYVFLTTSLDWAKNDLYIRKIGEGEFRPVAVGLDGRFIPQTYDNQLYVLTSWNAPRYRVIVMSATAPDVNAAKVIIPQQAGVIQEMQVVDGKLVLLMLENAHSRIAIHDLDGVAVKQIDLPALGSVNGLSGRPDHNELFFSFQSFAYPPVVFRYDMKSGDMKPIDRMDIEVALDQYETKQVWFHSKDGTRVPMFVTHRKGLQLDGTNPTLLTGYGGFEISETPNFDRGVLPWLESGGVYAVANLRGGGEFGRDWHAAGRLARKQNVFDDMIAAGEKLIADGYTSPEHLAAEGGSNGGLLMGALMTQRPDLFRAIVCQVPLLDMLRYTRFSIAQLWMPEYGDPADAEQFRWLYAYSPYHRVKRGAQYPAVLFTTAESDTRVDPMHARKMAAALQSASASDRPVLLWVETKAGHGAGKPLSKRIEAIVDAMTFINWQLGLWK
jgi:prolyl oligopeptidase